MYYTNPSILSKSEIKKLKRENKLLFRKKLSNAKLDIANKRDKAIKKLCNEQNIDYIDDFINNRILVYSDETLYVEYEMGCIEDCDFDKLVKFEDRLCYLIPFNIKTKFIVLHVIIGENILLTCLNSDLDILLNINGIYYSITPVVVDSTIDLFQTNYTLKLR